MICRECGEEMYLESTKGWYCKHCGIHTDIQGGFISRDRKVKIFSKPTINTINTIGTIATIKIISPMQV